MMSAHASMSTASSLGGRPTLSGRKTSVTRLKKKMHAAGLCMHVHHLLPLRKPPRLSL